MDLTSEPSHHLVLENAFVRVFDVSVAPRATTLVHRHDHDYVFVALGDAAFTNARTGAQPSEVLLNDGDARFTAGGFAHAARNNRDTIFRNITIEILNPATGERNCAQDCWLPCNLPDKSICPAIQRLFSSDQWVVTSVTLPPGAKLAEHIHASHHLAVAVTDLHLKTQSQGQPENETSAKTGDILWVNPVAHTVANAGQKPARFVTLEFNGTSAPEASHTHP
ncbi:MAG TPA: hypothetical protein VNW97_01315 [Candidatus Saccharimonadales bacterium]|nr:hypothetical protein [Candidatus Saccharimonadales bacterium]